MLKADWLFPVWGLLCWKFHLLKDGASFGSLQQALTFSTRAPPTQQPSLVMPFHTCLCTCQMHSRQRKSAKCGTRWTWSSKTPRASWWACGSTKVPARRSEMWGPWKHLVKTPIVSDMLQKWSVADVPYFPPGNSKPQWFQAPGKSLEVGLPAGHQTQELLQFLHQTRFGLQAFFPFPGCFTLLF